MTGEFKAVWTWSKSDKGFTPNIIISGIDDKVESIFKGIPPKMISFHGEEYNEFTKRVNQRIEREKEFLTFYGDCGYDSLTSDIMDMVDRAYEKGFADAAPQKLFNSGEAAKIIGISNNAFRQRVCTLRSTGVEIGYTPPGRVLFTVDEIKIIRALSVSGWPKGKSRKERDPLEGRAGGIPPDAGGTAPGDPLRVGLGDSPGRRRYCPWGPAEGRAGGDSPGRRRYCPWGPAGGPGWGDSPGCRASPPPGDPLSN